MDGSLCTPCLDLRSPACRKVGLTFHTPLALVQKSGPVCLSGSAFLGLRQGCFVVAAPWLLVLVCCLCFAFFQGRHLHAPILEVKVDQSYPTLRPHGLYSPWDSPGENTGVGSLSLLQGIFPTQGSNPGHPHCRQILYQLSHKGTPNPY